MGTPHVTPRERLALKRATAAQIELAGGGVAAAASTRVGPSPLSRYASDNDEHATTFVPVDVMLDLTREAGEATLLRAVASLAGFDLVPRRQVVAPGLDYAEHDTDCTKAACRFMMALRDARADGTVDARDRATLLSVTEALILELKELRADVERDEAAAATATVTPLRGR